jgi:two-component system alkaline phosphatase synthesis response regulator PhoP
MSRYSVLVVEDDPKIAQLLKLYLEDGKFNVILASDGNEGWRFFQEQKPDVVVLDLMLPGLDGWEICQRIRACSDLPVLMLTARGEIEERVKGLDMGADDYITKPFSFREVITRIKVIIRRANRQVEQRQMIRAGGLVIDIEKHQVALRGQLVKLTITEFKILELLATQPEQAFSRRSIVEYLQGTIYDGYERMLDAHIKNLRKKIESDPKCPMYIQTVYGIGYKFIGAINE